MEKSSPQSKGGKARAENLTSKQRSKIASVASIERWAGVPRSTKVTVAGKVEEAVLKKALVKSGLNKSALIEKLIGDYAA